MRIRDGVLDRDGMYCTRQTSVTIRKSSLLNGRPRQDCRFSLADLWVSDVWRDELQVEGVAFPSDRRHDTRFEC